MKLKSFVLFLILFRVTYGQEVESKIDKKDLRAFIETLSSIQFEGRDIANNGQIKTQKFIINRFKTLRIEPFSKAGYLEKFTVNKVKTANVIGVIRGNSEKSIVVSAHYDHMGWYKKEDATNARMYYPGADDNASGVAALLELAEEFAQYENLRYTMIFLATSAEEAGLLGSLHHVNSPDFDPEKIICNFNLDMISRCDNKLPDCNYLYCISDNRSEELDSLTREANKRFSDCTFNYTDYDSDIYYRTDTYNFSKKGIPSILFFAGFHDDYHRTTDTIEKIDFDILEKRVKLICEVLKLLQKE